MSSSRRAKCLHNFSRRVHPSFPPLSARIIIRASRGSAPALQKNTSAIINTLACRPLFPLPPSPRRIKRPKEEREREREREREGGAKRIYSCITSCVAPLLHFLTAGSTLGPNYDGISISSLERRINTIKRRVSVKLFLSDK